MKTSSVTHALALASVAAISLAFSPMLCAQASNPTADTSQNSKVAESTADKNSATTGSPTDQTGTLERTSSRDTTNSLDMNPSTAPTDSADKSATKNPTTTVQAQSNDAGTERSGRISDREFILNAAQGGITEGELGKLAQ